MQCRVRRWLLHASGCAAVCGLVVLSCLRVHWLCGRASRVRRCLLHASGCEDVCGLGIAMAVKFDYGFNDKFICLFLHFYYIYYYLRNTIDFCLVQFLLFVGAFYYVTL